MKNKNMIFMLIIVFLIGVICINGVSATSYENYFQYWQ